MELVDEAGPMTPTIFFAFLAALGQGVETLNVAEERLNGEAGKRPRILPGEKGSLSSKSLFEYPPSPDKLWGGENIETPADGSKRDESAMAFSSEAAIASRMNSIDCSNAIAEYQQESRISMPNVMLGRMFGSRLMASIVWKAASTRCMPYCSRTSPHVRVAAEIG